MGEIYDIIRKLKEKPIEAKEIGMYIASAVMENREQNDDVYSLGQQRCFRNKESSKVLSSLEKLVKEDNEEEKRRNERLSDNDILNEYRDIYSINFVYDALKFHYQARGNFEETCEFLGEHFLRSMKEKDEYHRKKTSAVSEYNEFLTCLTNGIRKKLGVRFR